MRKLGGWWRLWVALSGLWMAGAVGVTVFALVDLGSVNDFGQKMVRWNCSEFPDVPDKGTLAAARSRATSANDVATVSRLDAMAECRAAKDKDWSPVWHMNRSKILAIGTAATLGPPASLLVFGFLVGWVWRGFTKKD